MITATEAKEIVTQVKNDYSAIIDKVIKRKIIKELERVTIEMANRGSTRGSLIIDASKYKEFKYFPVEELSTIGRHIVKELEDLGYNNVYYHRTTGADIKIVWFWGGNV